MNRFLRNPVPPFWAERDIRWQGYTPAERGETNPLHAWKYDTEPLSAHFHKCVRRDVGPELCAYCDGWLREQSPRTIDHFEPESKRPELSLHWPNLFPCCGDCNSTYKRDRWSPDLLNPERDDVERILEFEPDSGNMRPRPGISAPDRVRALETIRILGLNEGHRPQGRRRVWTNLKKPPPLRDRQAVIDHMRNENYRFVAAQLLASWDDG